MITQKMERYKTNLKWIETLVKAMKTNNGKWWRATGTGIGTVEMQSLYKYKIGIDFILQFRQKFHFNFNLENNNATTWAWHSMALSMNMHILSLNITNRKMEMIKWMKNLTPIQFAEFIKKFSKSSL